MNYVFLLLFLLSCGGGSAGTATIKWSKVENECVNSSEGGYYLYHGNINKYAIPLNYNKKKIPSANLNDLNNPTYTLKVKNKYTFFKVSSYCGENESQETSILSYVYIK